MGGIVYLLCAFTSVSCAILLYRYYRLTHGRLLLWSAVGFSGLALNNIMLVVDLLIFPNIDLSLARIVPAFLGISFMTFGMLWDLIR